MDHPIQMTFESVMLNPLYIKRGFNSQLVFDSERAKLIVLTGPFPRFGTPLVV